MNAKQAYLLWVKENDPFVYKIALERYKAQRQQGLGTTQPQPESEGFFKSMIDTVKNVVPAVMGYKQQKKIMDLQIERAKQGKPPINAGEYAPVVKVDAAISPESEQAAKRIAHETLQRGIGSMKPWLLGGAAVMALLFFKMRR